MKKLPPASTETQRLYGAIGAQLGAGSVEMSSLWSRVADQAVRALAAAKSAAPAPPSVRAKKPPAKRRSR